MRVLFYAAAGLSQHVADELQEIAVAACGERVVLVTGLGATETAPMAICRPWPSDQSSAIGLPVPGIEAKLARVHGENDKLEVRMKGPSVTPGYWRRDDLTREAFDDEGFFCMGDAVRPVDPSDLAKGLVFDGRIKEDFKLSTGTWVSVGPLRARILTHFAPFVRDVVIAGHDRDEVGMLVVPDVEACRAICATRSGWRAGVMKSLRDSAVAERLSRLMVSFAASATGSASRVARALVLEEPPSLDAGEVTDKGSLNQGAILRRRQRAGRGTVRCDAVGRESFARSHSMNADDLIAIDVHVHLEHDAGPTDADTAAHEVLRAKRRRHGRRTPSPSTIARARWRASSLPSTSGSRAARISRTTRSSNSPPPTPISPFRSSASIRRAALRRSQKRGV